MKRIAMIHTVKSVYEDFGERVREAIPELEIKIHNILDDFLASDAAPSEHGCFTSKNMQRLLLQLQAGELTEADLIVVTCSQLTTMVKQYTERISTPTITIDEAMVEKAVQNGPRIALLCTAVGTVAPMMEFLHMEAARQKRSVVIQEITDENAIRALKDGNMAEHNRIVREMATRVSRCDVVILAQASSAHMENEITSITGLPTLTSPALCIERIRKYLLR